LISRDFPFIKEIKFTINFKIDDNILLNFNTIKHNGINLSINTKLKYIKNTPFKYYLSKFNELLKAINQSINKGDKRNYCKLISNEYAFCISNEMLFIIYDYSIKEQQNLSIILPYEETDENTELNW
jgi:hypothetical protein